MLRNPVKVEVAPFHLLLIPLINLIYFVEKDDKLDLLIHILQDQKTKTKVLVLPEQNTVSDKLPENSKNVIFRQKQFMEISLKMPDKTALNNFKIKTEFWCSYRYCSKRN